MSDQLRSVLVGLQFIPTLDQASKAMNMGARSLRRHLRSEGTTFQRVLDSLRKNLALEYLGPQRMHSKQVAHMLGFSSSGAFRRAFKTWVGKSVADYQEAFREAKQRDGSFTKRRTSRRSDKELHVHRSA